MAVAIMREYQPIPAGIYNLQVEDYEERASTTGKGGNYYLWTLKVLDPLPDDYTGRGTFTVMTATDLTPNNNLRKFLSRLGFEQELEVGQGVDLDSFKGTVFVGKVNVEKAKNGQVVNRLGEITVPEYTRWLSLQTQQPAVASPVVAKAPARATVATAPASVAKAPVPAPVRKAQTLAAAPAPAATAATRPAVVAAAPRPTVVARPAPRPVIVQQPVVEETSAEEQIVEGGDQGQVEQSVSDFPQ